MKKGAFITIYGVNNMGKTTHANLLVKRLINEGYKSIYIKYPVYDIEPSGPYIDKILRSPSKEQEISEDELQLWFVINRYQFQPKLEELLKKGYIVVAEDYSGTGIAWGISKGLDKKWIEAINNKLIKEDLGILFEGARVLTAREKNHVHEQNDELIEKCRKIHEDLSKKYHWKRVKLQEKIEDTAKILWKTVSDFLENF